MPGAYDIFFQLAPEADQNGRQLFTFAYQSARGVRGFQKTLNQWLKCLMTRKGSDLTAKTYGTLFPDMFTSNTFSVDDVSERILLAASDATAQILAFQRAQSLTALPQDERLASVSVLSVQETAASQYTAYLLLKNVLNQDVKYVLPTF